MCTVTYIPAKDTIFLTSNRDEKNWRKDALAPAVYEFSTGRILFPKDADAGGTWIALHENGNAIIFLNGGFIAHQSQPPYRRSRGMILLDLIDSVTPYNSFLAIKLINIEPFTAVIWDDRQLFECRWDGEQKYTRQLNEHAPHIWSSVTLYDEATISKRNQWFEDWLKTNKQPDQEAILHFHQFTGDGDSHNDLKMDRNGKVGTVSVTSLAIEPKKATIEYLDLKNNSRESEVLTIEKTIVTR